LAKECESADLIHESKMIDTGLANKVALVTGANHGIGEAIALGLAAQGASVFLHYFCPLEELLPQNPKDVPGELLLKKRQSQTADRIVESIKEKGSHAAAWACDLGQSSNISRLFDEAETALGPIDILVNNAASWTADSFLPLEDQAEDRIGRTLASISEETINLHFKVITQATALMMAEFARRRAESKSTWGRVVNISTGGAYCFPEEVSYGAAKFAVEGYSRSAAKELGRLGITVNVVAPGGTQTGWITPEFEREIAAQTPLRRVGQPDDVADVVVFLCSHQARWITGQLIHVGGGSVV
jgi:3-oxoacyl-[acyl-carrier protein] reductase